jgi:putative endonuclease
MAKRYRSKLGEIDIIAARGKTLAFVEVKARGSRRAASEAITPRQRERLGRAAADFLARHPRYNRHVLRFDAMLVMPWRWPVHVPNAWQDSSR